MYLINELSPSSITHTSYRKVYLELRRMCADAKNNKKMKGLPNCKVIVIDVEADAIINTVI